MKCVWIAGAGSFLAVVVSLALLPCLMPAPIGVGPDTGIANAATSTVQVTDIQYASENGQTRPALASLTFTTEKPQVVGRLYVNEQGKLAFEGDVDVSAKAFLDEVMRQAEARKAAQSVTP